MRRCTSVVFLGFLLGLPAPAAAGADGDPARSFADPPPSARTRAYWWWLNGNVTKAAITRDLEEMKAKGFGGAILFDADGSNHGGNRRAPAGPVFLSPPWRELFRHAVREAERVDLELSVSIQSGWNLGGPMVTPERAAKLVAWSQTAISGPGEVETALPEPSRRAGFYRDIAVVAYRDPGRGLASEISAGSAHAEHTARHRPITGLEHKLAMRELGGSAPDGSVLLDDLPSVPGEKDCRSVEVLDLSDKMDPAGRLRWRVPEGEWVVLRLGYTCSGAKVATSSQGWTGLVLDYLDADALRWYWQEVVQLLIDDAGPAVGKTWRYLHTDSWECGGMNWTPGFRDEFRKRRGYDLTPFLPVMAGKIVDNRDVTNRFLADFRKTIGDCIAENHYGVMKELAHQHGMGIHPESGGPHGAPIDSLQCLGLSDIPMSEFWAKSWRHRVSEESRFFVKQPASAAHTYGWRLVAAEGFTTIGPHWQETVWDNLKPSFDRACCEGLNRLFWTLVCCSPAEMGMPGQEMFAGTHFNPNSTWWDKSHAFLTCLNRCQYLLQQGLFVADACYYYGDHVPNFTQLKKSDPARVLPGYDYDVATEEVVLTRMTVKNGRIVLPDGMTYRLLVLPDRTNISLPVLRKIKQLVQAGATVLGPKPQRATGLQDYPRCDEEVRAIAEEVWGPCDGKAVTVRSFGKGRVIWGPTARKILAADGVPPDAEFRVEVNGQQLSASGTDWIHRRDGGMDIFFVCNRQESPQIVEAVFRVGGKQPELWNPVTGSLRDAGAFTQAHGLTAVPLELAPYESLFVVFRKPIPETQRGTVKSNAPVFSKVAEIAGPWQVSFDPRWGGPEKVVFEKLDDWTNRSEEGIRHYSGTAVYRKAFDLPPAARAAMPAGKRLFLDLGTVKELAEVRLNGQNLGVVWCPPWRVEVTAVLREQENLLEVDIVNFWPNRLIGDAALPPEKRRTATNINKFTSDSPLMESGLLGPVTLRLQDITSP